MICYFNNKIYNVKITFRCYFKYEQIAKHPFDENNYNQTIWMYSILKASNKDFELTFDDFKEKIIKNEDIVKEFIDRLQKEIDKLQKENNSVFLLNNVIYKSNGLINKNQIISTEDIYVILVHEYKFSPIYLFDEASIDEINILIKDYYEKQNTKIV